MASEHDRDLAARIADGAARGVLAADDPAGVLDAVLSVEGTVAVAGTELTTAIAAARVRLAEVLVARARRAERASTPDGVGDGPAVRAAEAHLRRQQAAWKLVWWEREQVVPDLAAWSPRLTATVPITLVSIDGAGGVDAEACASMRATAPAAVGVVVLQPRWPEG